MSAPTFIFGAEGLPKTPQEAARLRAIAQAMAPQGAPKNVGEGLTSLGNAIAYRMMMNKAAAGEAQGTNAANNAFTALMSSLGGGTTPAASSVSNSAQAPSTAPTPANQPPIPGIQAAQGGGMEAYRNAIASIESAGSGDYAAVGPTHPKMGRALGRYQVMEANIGPWSQEVLGRAVTPEEFMANPQLQDKIFDGKFQSYVKQYGPEGAAQAWFGGEGGVGKTNRKDSLGTSIGEYGNKFSKAIGSVDAVNAMGAETGYVDPMVSAPNSRAPIAQALSQAQPVQVAQAGNGRRGIMDALMAGQPRSQDMPADYFPAAPNPPGVNGPSRQQILRVLTDQFSTPEQRAIAQEELQRMQQANDPVYQMQLEKSRLELEAMRNPKVDPLKVGQGETIIDPVTREVIFKTDPKPENKPAGILEYEYAKQQGFPGTFQDWEASKKGGMSLQVDPATGAVTFQQGNNIKPMTEAQSKDAVFSTRAEGALPLIDQFSDSLTGTEGMVGGTAGQLPVVGNFMKSEGYQQAEQAGKEFLQAILRKDTGAAITTQETNEYGSVYLPRPGDSAAVIQQKKVSRKRALEAIKAGMPPQAILAQEKALANTNAPEEVKPPEGVDPEIWNEMTPEEKALWK